MRTLASPTGITANVLFEDPSEALLAAADEAQEARLAHGPNVGAMRQGEAWVFPQGWRVDDTSDPDSGLILLHWLATDGLSAIVSAPDLEGDEDGVNELERRITRDVSGDFTIDDWGAQAASPSSERVSRVNHEALAAMDDAQLADLIGEGGPSELIDAARALRQRRSDALHLSMGEASAVLEALGDSELYVQYEDDGWVSVETFNLVLNPLLQRLRQIVPAPKPEPRTILVHLNVELPADAPCSPEDVAREVEAALEVGTDPEHTPALAIASVCVPLVDEV